MTCVKCHHESTKKCGYSGKRKLQRYRCSQCHFTFVELDQYPLLSLVVMVLPAFIMERFSGGKICRCGAAGENRAERCSAWTGEAPVPTRADSSLREE